MRNTKYRLTLKMPNGVDDVSFDETYKMKYLIPKIGEALKNYYDIDDMVLNPDILHNLLTRPHTANRTLRYLVGVEKVV